jgi:hypothetical protein
MQTERVTFLADQNLKASLEAFAAARKQSVGHVLREASSHWISLPADRGDEDNVLDLLVPLLDELVPEWTARIDSMESSIDEARKAIDDVLRGDPA